MIYCGKKIFIESEESKNPWVKIFTKEEFKEISDCDESIREELFKVALEVERLMLEFYKPDKINWASFGNLLPKVHIHIIARFKDDSHFPESMWGEARRIGKNYRENFDDFAKLLQDRLANLGF